MTKPSCILTGATGYIGSRVVKHLLSEGWRVSVIVKPTSALDNIEEVVDKVRVCEYDGRIDTLIAFFDEMQAEVVMHLAAAAIIDHSPKQVKVLVDSNVGFGAEVLEAMRYSRTRLFVGTGSYWQNYDSDDYNPVDLYAATKEAFEKILQYYVDAHGFRAITLRLFDVYGEDDKRPKLWNILRDIAGTDRSIDLTSGEQLLDMVHISDVVRAYEAAYSWLCDHPELRNEVYGVDSGVRMPLRDIVELFREVIAKPINLNWGAKPYRPREVMKPASSYVRLPNWNAKVQLMKGLTKFRGGVILSV